MNLWQRLVILDSQNDQVVMKYLTTEDFCDTIIAGDCLITKTRIEGLFYMQYLGGKSKISKDISEVINALFRWEKSDFEGNFCGNRERERERAKRS